MSSVNLNPEELAVEICMSQNKQFLIVEGPTDKRFWGRYQSNCVDRRILRVANTVDCNGNRDYVINVISSLNEKGVKNTIGIIDHDLDIVNNSILKIKSLLYYKYHDLEVMLLKSTALEQFINEIVSEDVNVNIKAILDDVFRGSYNMGILRFTFFRLGINLSVDTINIGKIYLKTEVNKFLEYVRSHYSSDLSQEKFEIVKETFKSILLAEHKFENICNGHDSIKVLYHLIASGKIKVRGNHSYNDQIITSMLILAYNVSGMVAKNQFSKDCTVVYV